MTCIVLVSGTLPDFRWVKWNNVPSAYPSSLDFERGSYTLVDPVQYETVHVEGKYGVKVNIRNVTPKDFGLYTCYVSNHLGSDYRSAFLSERTDRWKESEGKIVKLLAFCENDRIAQLPKPVVYEKKCFVLYSSQRSSFLGIIIRHCIANPTYANHITVNRK